MPDSDILNRQFRPEFRRERKLHQTPPSRPPPAPDAGQAVTTLAENYRHVAEKAGRILSEASKLAIVRRVPVDAEATTVQAATQRQDPTSQGQFITFDLYQRSTVYLQQTQRVLPVEILDSLTGDPIADHQRITSTIRSITDDISEAAASLLGNQLVTLFVLKLLQLGYDSVEGGQQSATKQPSAVELPIIAANVAISLAAQQLYAGLNKKQAEDALRELGEAVVPGNEQAAKKYLAESPLFQAALTERKPVDHQLIVDYVRVFLDRQTDPGWETWQVIPDLQDLQHWGQESADFLTRYGRSEAKQSTKAPADSLKHLTSLLQPSTSTETTIDLGASVQALYGRGLKALNQQVDDIAHLLADTINSSGLCCFLKFLNQTGTQPVRMLRGLLETRQLNFQVPTISPPTASLALSTNIHQHVMLLLQDLQQTLFRRLKEWFTSSAEQWEDWFQCSGMIDELVEYVVGGIEQLEETMISLLDRFLGYIEEKEQQLQGKTNAVGNQKRLRFVMTTMDQWLEFGGAEGLCPSSETEPTQLATVAERVLEKVGSSIQLPQAGDNPYRAVQSPPLELSTGAQMPATLGSEAGRDLLDLARQACGRRPVQEGIPFPRTP